MGNGDNVEFIEKHTQIGKIQQKLFENRPKDAVLRNFTVITNEKVQESYMDSPKWGENHRFLRAKNTQNLFKVDLDDWEVAKAIPWYEQGDGTLTTFKGQRFEDYVGIPGARKYPFSPRDLSREHYHGC